MAECSKNAVIWQVVSDRGGRAAPRFRERRVINTSGADDRSPCSRHVAHHPLQPPLPPPNQLLLLATL
jgi:hypothetical protein